MGTVRTEEFRKVSAPSKLMLLEEGVHKID